MDDLHVYMTYDLRGRDQVRKEYKSCTNVWNEEETMRGRHRHLRYFQLSRLYFLDNDVMLWWVTWWVWGLHCDQYIRAVTRHGKESKPQCWSSRDETYNFVGESSQHDFANFSSHIQYSRKMKVPKQWKLSRLETRMNQVEEARESRVLLSIWLKTLILRWWLRKETQEARFRGQTEQASGSG